MAFLVYFFVLLVAAASVLFGLDWTQAPLNPPPYATVPAQIAAVAPDPAPKAVGVKPAARTIAVAKTTEKPPAKTADIVQAPVPAAAVAAVDPATQAQARATAGTAIAATATSTAATPMTTTAAAVGASAVCAAAAITSSRVRSHGAVRRARQKFLKLLLVEPGVAGGGMAAGLRACRDLIDAAVLPLFHRLFHESGLGRIALVVGSVDGEHLRLDLA